MTYEALTGKKTLVAGSSSGIGAAPAVWYVSTSHTTETSDVRRPNYGRLFRVGK